MKVQKAYNLWAKQYDYVENPTRDLDKKSTIETLSKYDFENVIELGCGTGKNTMFLLEKAKKIIGLDFSQKMLNQAKAKLKDGRVLLQQADITQNWEIKNNFADLITSSLTLEHIEDLDHIFHQAFLKLKKDGIFFISEYHPFKQYLGKKARFETEEGLVEIDAFVHNTSEYLDSAKANGFELLEIKEWFDEEPNNELPRLISFVFKK